MQVGEDYEVADRFVAPMSRIVIVDDHPLVVLGLRALFGGIDHLRIVGDATDAVRAIQIIRELAPDLALVDLRLGATDGSILVAQIKRAAPRCRVIGLSAIDNPVQIASMLRAGAQGFVLKSQPMTELVEAIECVQDGRTYLPPSIPREQIEASISTPSPFDRLTPREQEVLLLTMNGSSSAEVAQKLDISSRTAESHRQHIMNKVDCHSVIELSNLARIHGVGGR